MGSHLFKKNLLEYVYRAERFLTRHNPEHLWNRDARFSRLMREIRNRTLVDFKRCWMLYQFASVAADLPGEIAELGAWRGGTAKIIAFVTAKSGKPIHLFDTWTGLPATTGPRDPMQAGELCDASLEDTRAFLGSDPRIRFYPGLFPDTAAGLADRTFCFVHLDADIYKSTRDACLFFYPRTVAGGYLIFDDYGFPSCRGVREAVDEFFLDKPEKPLYLTTGQCVVIKR